MKDVEEYRSNWRLFWWIVSTICIPFTIPYLLMKILGNMKEKKFRNCLPGKVVVITGASSGLGERLAHTFYIAGCRVVLCARRKDELQRVRKDLLELHSTITTYPPVAVPLDLSDINSLPDRVQDILNIHGQIDILINNGGISVRSECLSTAIDVDIKVMLVNYFGTVALTKAAMPSMIQRKEGRIVCVGSVQGKFAIPHRSAYTASKHALQAFCDSLRAEIDEHNIKVTLISPGYIKTSLSLNALTGSGKNYGKLDPTTESGYSTEYVSRRILKAILRDEKDLVIAPVPPVAAIWLRFFCPSLYFWIMARRARKLAIKNK